MSAKKLLFHCFFTDMTDRLELQEPPQQSENFEIVQPSRPHEELRPVGVCSCAESVQCELHNFISQEEIAEPGRDRVDDPFVQKKDGKILCYRALAGWIPELRDRNIHVHHIRSGIARRVGLVTGSGELFRGGEQPSAVLDRFADPAGNFPPRIPTGSKFVVTAHEGSDDKYGRYPHDFDPARPPSYLKISEAPRVVIAKRPDDTVLRHLNSEPLPFKSSPTDVQTLAVYDPGTKLWKAQVVPNGELGADHWERMYHYPDGFITGMVFYTGEDGIYGFRIDQHILRACRDAKRRGFEGVNQVFLRKLFAEHLAGDKRWVPRLGNQPGNRYYGRFIGYPTNSAPPLRGKEKEMLFLGTPVGPYRNVQMLNIQQMGPRPVVKGFGDVKHPTNYAGPVEMFAQYQDAGYHEAMFMADTENGQKRVQEGTSVNYAFVHYFADGGPTIKIPSLRHGDILPGITMQSVADLAATYGYMVITDGDVGLDELRSADEILVTGTAMTVRGVGRVDGVDGHPVFENKTDGEMGPVAKRLAGDLQKILQRKHPDPALNGWMQKIVSF